MTAMTPSANFRLNLRGFTSVMSLLCFVILTLSGFLLFFMPPGKVANLGDFSMLGLGKTQWQVLHISFSLLFLAFGMLHLILNWRVMVNYFKSRPKRRFAFNWQWVLPILICAAVVWGATAGTWPFSQIEQWRREIKAEYGGGRQFETKGQLFQGRRQQSKTATQPVEEDRQIRKRYRGAREQ